VQQKAYRVISKSSAEGQMGSETFLALLLNELVITAIPKVINAAAFATGKLSFCVVFHF
jgi:hypothetical protein